MRGAGTSRRAAEAAASRAARGALSLFLSGALEEGFHRGGGDDNVASAAAEIAQRNATPKTWNTGPSRTDAPMNIQSDISTDAPGADDTTRERKSGSGQRGLLDIQLAQEREAAEAALAARGWAATASRSVPGKHPESLPSRSQSVDTNSNVNIFSTSGGGPRSVRPPTVRGSSPSARSSARRAPGTAGVASRDGRMPSRRHHRRGADSRDRSNRCRGGRLQQQQSTIRRAPTGPRRCSTSRPRRRPGHLRCPCHPVVLGHRSVRSPSA